MPWRKMLAYITGIVDQELLLRNEYVAAANRTRSAAASNAPRVTLPTSSSVDC